MAEPQRCIAGTASVRALPACGLPYGDMSWRLRHGDCDVSLKKLYAACAAAWVRVKASWKNAVSDFGEWLANQG